jgi:hypothetical protein
MHHVKKTKGRLTPGKPLTHTRTHAHTHTHTHTHAHTHTPATTGHVLRARLRPAAVRLRTRARGRAAPGRHHRRDWRRLVCRRGVARERAQVGHVNKGLVLATTTRAPATTTTTTTTRASDAGSDGGLVTPTKAAITQKKLSVSLTHAHLCTAPVAPHYYSSIQIHAPPVAPGRG